MLEVVFGNMTSGKTTEIAEIMKGVDRDLFFVVAPMSCRKRKKFFETDEQDIIQSRNNDNIKVDLFIDPECDLVDTIRGESLKKPFDTILVDEINFLTDEHAYQLKMLAESGYTVKVYGLRSTYNLVPFPSSIIIAQLADTMRILPSYCSCGKPSVVDALDKFEVVNSKIDFVNASYAQKCFLCYAGDCQKRNSRGLSQYEAVIVAQNSKPGK